MTNTTTSHGTERSCAVCNEATSWDHGVVDFYGNSAESMGIPMGFYHYTCVHKTMREGIATCDLCGSSAPHNHDAEEYGDTFDERYGEF